MAAFFDRFANFDLNVFAWFDKVFNCGSNPVLDTIMKIITTLGDSGIIWILLAVILVITKKYRKYGMMMGGALIFMLIANNLVLKNLIARPRPFLYFADNPLFRFPEIISRDTLASTSNATGFSYSFPSGHTTSSFAAVIPMFLGNKKYGAVALVMAILIAASRIYMHVHYCTDILAGVVMGFIYGIIGCLIIAAVIRLIESKKPALATKIFPDVK